MLTKNYDGLRVFGNVRIPLHWSAAGQFFLSVSDIDGELETRPLRVYNDGRVLWMGDVVKAPTSKELAEHIADANCGDFSRWEEKYFDDDDVCRNGKPIAECECC